MNVSGKIHPTAIIHTDADVSENVSVGPFSIIDENVSIGKGTVIGNNVTITGRTTIGNNNKIFHSSSIGEAPQDKKYNNEDTKLIIQNKAIIQSELELQKINILAEGSPGKGIILYNNNGLNIYDTLLELFNKVAEIDTKNIEPLLKDITNKKNIFGIRIINILITIYLNRAFRRSLQLIRFDISTIEKESQDNFLQFFNITDIPALWENISTKINFSLKYNLDKKQTLINMIENIKNLKKNNELYEGS